MQAAINCLERELATLAMNFAVDAERVTRAAPDEDRDPDLAAQQDIRWNSMQDIHRALGHLTSRVQYEAESREARTGSPLGNAAIGQIATQMRI